MEKKINSLEKKWNVNRVRKKDKQRLKQRQRKTQINCKRER